LEKTVKMKKEIKRNPKVIAEEWDKKRASTEHYVTLIKEYGMYQLEGGESILYLDLEEIDKKLIQAFKNVTYYSNIRTGGLKSNSALLGYKPRNPKKDNYCSIAGMASNHPLEHDIFLATSRMLAGIYQENFPETYRNHMNKLKELKNDENDRLLDQYILEQTPFTSGIVNKDNELAYHTDNGNVEETYSAMIVLKNDVVGGYLSLPEYDIAIDLKDNSALFFNGQKILHGVTPIYKTTEEAYRYSVVFYTMEEMWRCGTLEEELNHSREYYEKKDAEQNKD